MSKGTVIKGFLIIIALAAMVAVRVGYLQRSHYIDAEAHYAAGEQKLAVREYGSALHLHFPFSPYSKRSALRLWSMGLDFEEEGKPQWAQMAFTSLRSSFYASRSFYTPGRRWIEKCDEKLASLRAAMLVEAGSIDPGEFEAERLRHLEALRADRAPVPIWAVLAGVSFFGFLASVAFLIFRGFNSEARLKKKEARAGLIAAAVTFALWVLSLMMA
jgi:hypothetical protein